MILTRALEHGWRQRADLHASLMVPSALLLALLDAVQAGRVMADTVDKIRENETPLFQHLSASLDALAAWRKVVGE
jgi:hypothetical protein